MLVVVCDNTAAGRIEGGGTLPSRFFVFEEEDLEDFVNRRFEAGAVSGAVVATVTD